MSNAFLELFVALKPQCRTFHRLEVTTSHTVPHSETSSLTASFCIAFCPALDHIHLTLTVRHSKILMQNEQPLGPMWLQSNTSGNPCKSAMGLNENSPFQLHSGSAEHQINPLWQLYSRKKLIEGVGLHLVKFIVTLIRTPGHKWPSHRHAWLTVMLIKITKIIKSMLLCEPLYKH